MKLTQIPKKLVVLNCYYIFVEVTLRREHLHHFHDLVALFQKLWELFPCSILKFESIIMISFS